MLINVSINRKHVLHKSSGLDDMNWISWRLVLCLMGSWVMVYLSIIKGISSMGKVSVILHQSQPLLTLWFPMDRWPTLRQYSRTWC